MPIIQFDDSDKLRALVADAGWYKAIIKTMEMKNSKEGNSVNFWTEFEITSEGKFKHKEIKCCFNTKVNSPSLLGGIMFRPHSDLIPLYAAVMNLVNDKGQLNLDAVPLNLNTDDMLVKEFDLRVGLDTTDGNLNNTPDGWLPVGKATGAQNKELAF